MISYIVMVRVWSSDGYDYMSGEYSGIRHNDHNSALDELREAIYDVGEGDAWIVKEGD